MAFITKQKNNDPLSCLAMRGCRREEEARHAQSESASQQKAGKRGEALANKNFPSSKTANMLMRVDNYYDYKTNLNQRYYKHIF